MKTFKALKIWSKMHSDLKVEIKMWVILLTILAFALFMWQGCKPSEKSAKRYHNYHGEFRGQVMNGKELSERVVFWCWTILLVGLLLLAMFGCSAAYYAKNQPNKWETYPDSCCMFTGLHDKNGVP